MSPIRLCLPLALAAALAGCGETRIDATKAEGLIRDLVVKQVGARVTTVACPAGIIAKKGATFSCHVAAADRTSGDVIVTSRDTKGSVEVNAPFLLVRHSEAEIAKQITGQSYDEVKVRCPEIIVIEKGSRFRCTAKDGNRSRVINGQFVDDSGQISYELG